MLKDTIKLNMEEKEYEKIKLKKNMVNFLLTVLAFMATAGVNNYSISGLYQPKNQMIFVLKYIQYQK